MTAVAFSLDGSVLAVAAETVITLWDPDKNVLLAVIGETLSVIGLKHKNLCLCVSSESSLFYMHNFLLFMYVIVPLPELLQLSKIRSYWHLIW